MLRLAMMAMVGSVSLGAVSQTPTQTLKARDAEIRAALPPAGQKPTATQEEKIEQAALSTIDLKAMAQAALGKYWAEEPQSKRQEFLNVFRDRFREATAQQWSAYRQAQTQFLPEQRISDDEVKVPTKLTVSGEPTEVDYLMRKEDSGWKVVDIIVDGVSTVDHYRDVFAQAISAEGFDGLIARLRNAGKPSQGTGGAGNTGKATGTGGSGH